MEALCPLHTAGLPVAGAVLGVECCPPTWCGEVWVMPDLFSPLLLHPAFPELHGMQVEAQGLPLGCWHHSPEGSKALHSGLKVPLVTQEKETVAS